MKRIHYLYTLGLLFALTTGFVACSDETAAGGETPRPVTVSLQIGAGQEALTKAEDEDDKAIDGEFMHTLTVFVCNANNQIVKKLEVESLSDVADHTFDNIQLSKGSYSFYAFANCEKLSELNDVLALSEGNTMSADVVNNTLTIDKPHEDLSFESGDNRIPMSGKTEKMQITSDQTVTIEMIRMVSRIQVTVNNLQGGTPTIGSDLTLHGVAKKVKLFGDGTGVTGDVLDISIPFEGSTTSSNYLYIPESYNNHRFTLTVDDIQRTGFTSTYLVRNHIYLFVINLRDYKLELTVEYDAPPIGGIVTPKETTTGYEIAIKEGSTFTIKAVLKQGEEPVVVKKWEIEVGENEIPITTNPIVPEGTLFAGSIPAQPTSNTTTLVLKATDMEDKVHSFDLTISVKNLETKSTPTGSDFPMLTLPQVVGIY
ncbi:FimB/Mfa2 family fimbrial subunit [Parabacteroides sp.]